MKAARRGTVKLPAGSVRAWSEVSLKLPFPGLDFGSIGMVVGHERIAKSSSQNEIENAFRLLDEANEKELERRLKKYVRMCRRILEGVDDDVIESSGSVGAQSRARAALDGGKKKSKKDKGKK